MGPGRLTGMNVSRTSPGSAKSPRFNGARSIDRDERRTHGCRQGKSCRSSFNGARSIDRDERRSDRAARSSSRSCFNGARSIDRDERPQNVSGVHDASVASMGPGRLTGMNAWFTGPPSES